MEEERRGSPDGNVDGCGTAGCGRASVDAWMGGEVKVSTGMRCGLGLNWFLPIAICIADNGRSPQQIDVYLP